VRAFVVAASFLAATVVAPALNATSAYATATVTEPSGSTVKVAVDASGYAAPFTVRARGFEPYENVYIEQCNGRPPSAEHWSATLDCDLSSAPAPAIAGTDGTVTFLASDPNHALHPFVGESPQALFNCLAAKGVSPANGMPDFRDCQLRISSSNTAGTDDQVFLTLALPDGARNGWSSPEFPGSKQSGSGQAGSKPSGSGQAGSKPSGSGGAGSGGAAAPGSSGLASSGSGSGTSSGSSFPYAAVLALVALVAAGATFFLLHKRRSGELRPEPISPQRDTAATETPAALATSARHRKTHHENHRTEIGGSR
jgi:hypothetical protein